MKNRQEQKGFTLIETVICLALVSIISAAFLYVMLGSAKTQQAGNAYDQRSAALLSALETKELADGMHIQPVGRLQLNLGSGAEITLVEYTLNMVGDEQGVCYYQYDTP